MGLIALVLVKFTQLPFCISVHSDYEKRFALNPQVGLKNTLGNGRNGYHVLFWLEHI